MNEIDQIKSFIKGNLNILIRIIAGTSDLKSNDIFMVQAKEVDLLEAVFSHSNTGGFQKANQSGKLSQQLFGNIPEIDSSELQNFIMSQVSLD